MGIKTVPHPPHSRDLAPCDFCLFLSSEAIVMRQLRRWKSLWQSSLTRSHKSTSMGPSRSCWNGTIRPWKPKRLLRSGPEFHVSTINKSAHTQKVWKLFNIPRKAGWPARIYIQQLCEDIGCNPEDLLEAMNDREKWGERVRDIRAGGATWWWWWYNIYSFNF